jgi:bifunctional DNase/RNase
MSSPADADSIPVRLVKVVAVGPGDGPSFCAVLEGVQKDLRFPIEIGATEGLHLAAPTGVQFGRPMCPPFTADLLRAVGGRIREVRIDRLLPMYGGTAYGATVDVQGPSGITRVDARPSDALNLLALLPAPIGVAREVLADAQARMAENSPEGTSS